MIYDITDKNVSMKAPDTLPEPGDLQMGDKIGRYQYCSLTFASVDMPNDIGLLYLFCFVASIQPNKKFKVYWQVAERSDINMTAAHGYKVRDAAFAHELFPMLVDYELIYS